MRHRSFAPPPHLRHVVRSVWFLDDDGRQGAYEHRATATGCAEVIATVHGRFVECTPDAAPFDALVHLHAQTLRPRRFRATGAFAIVGLHLYPHAVPTLFGLPSTDVVDTLPLLPDMVGGLGREFEERMMECTTLEQWYGVAVRFVEDCLRRHGRQDTAMAHLADAVAEAVVLPNAAWMTQASGLSRRQLERRFAATVGMSPARYLQVLRFQRALKRLDGTDDALLDVALETGYFDQPHFNRDIRRFTGLSPTDYRRLHRPPPVMSLPYKHT